MCQACLDASRNHIKEKRANGSCIRCSKDNKAVAAGMCLRCWYRKMASDCCGVRGAANLVLADELSKLWGRQRGLCALTGITLVPGENASLDHVTPRSKGGGNEISNLRWIDFPVNRAKSDMSDDELRELCRRILDYRPNDYAATDAKTGEKNVKVAATLLT